MSKLGKFWTDAVAYVALVIGAGLSIAGNVADTYRTRGQAVDALDIVMAVAWPALVVLMVEIFVSTRWTGLAGPMQALRWLGTLAIGGMAMRVSWVHLNDLMASRGQKADVAIFGPLAIDCLAIMATALILAGRRGQKQLAKPDLRWVNPGQVAKEDMDKLATQLANVGQTPPWATLANEVGQGDDGQQDVYAAMAADEAELAETYGTVADEASNYLARLATHPDLDGTTTPAVPVVPGDLPQRKRTVKYDRDRAVAAILCSLEQGTPGPEIDQSVAEAFGVSPRTARRLRSDVTGQPVSGPPSDSEE